MSVQLTVDSVQCDSIAEGDTVAVTLTFEKAGTAIVNLTAAGTAADAPAGHMGH